MDDVIAFVDGRAREDASDPTVNVALEASAGTGKTRILVDRYLRLLSEGTSPRHILAITFTRKAAGEMKTRIIEELRKRPLLWREIRTRLFEMHVTTIDAFCLGLLREFPLEAGLDPDLELIDEVESDRLKEEAVDETLFRARRGRGVDIRFLVARFGEGALRRGLLEFLSGRLTKEEILDRYVAHVLPATIPLEQSLKRASESLSSAFRGNEGVERFLETGPDTPSPGFVALRFALERALDPARVTTADIEEVRSYFLTASNEPRRRLSPIASRDGFVSRESYERHRDRVLGLAPLVARVYRQWIRDKDFYAVRQIHALYRDAARRFTELKRARAGLDFTDVLVEAVGLLEKRGEFSQSRFRLESRYHHLLIDEFQDTNEVQWRLLRALVDSWGEGAGLVQEAILSEQSRGEGAGRIQEPSLFIVGDRKQSIYGWRDARVEVLERATRHLLRIRPGGGRKLTLRHSFRAGGELLSFLNDVFSDIPKVRADLEWSFQYRDTDHFPVTENRQRSTPVALAVGRDLATVSSAIADEIVRIVEEDGRRPKDIAILFRSRSSYRSYEEALVSRGVPAYVYRGLGFFDSPEVMDLQALVRFLAEPASELRAAELARSRFVAVSDEGLVRIAIRAKRRASVGDTPLARWLANGLVDLDLPMSDADRAAVSRASRLVPGWLAWVDRVPAAELLERILQESEYAAWFVDDRQAWENLKKVMEMVRRADNRGYLTMSRLADFLASARTEEESEAVLEAVDAVNLMTIHAAKGLEFDSVFLVNMHQRCREDTSLPRIRELADGRIEVTALAPGEEEDELEREPMPNRVEEEEKRLLYVALTRARRNLTLSTVVTEEKRSVFRLLPESLRGVFREALEGSEPEVEWRGHSLRVLRAAGSRRLHEEKQERLHRLRLEPLAPDALEARVVELGDGHPVDSISLPDLQGETHREVRFSLVRGGELVRGTIELLVVSPKTVSLVERDSPGSQAHIEVQLEAAASLFPGREIQAYLVGPDRAPRLVTRGGASRGEQLDLF